MAVNSFTVRPAVTDGKKAQRLDGYPQTETPTWLCEQTKEELLDTQVDWDTLFERTPDDLGSASSSASLLRFGASLAVASAWWLSERAPSNDSLC